MRNLTESRRAIVYEAVVDVRFSDFDANGHVNAARYFDLVLTGRWKFFQERFGVGPTELAQRNLGFYVSRVETFFRKPILLVNAIRIRSQVVEAQGARMVATYEVLSLDGQTRHADGNFDFAAIDLARSRPQLMPDWAVDFFFEKE